MIRLIGWQPGETEEEYEERRWKGRTQQMMHIVSRGLQKNTNVSATFLWKSTIFGDIYYLWNMAKKLILSMPSIVMLDELKQQQS